MSLLLLRVTHASAGCVSSVLSTPRFRHIPLATEATAATPLSYADFAIVIISVTAYALQTR